MQTAALAETSPAPSLLPKPTVGAAPLAEEDACKCATSVAEVEAAWHLVYNRYSAMGLIDENVYGMHAARTAVGPHACVIWGPDGPDVGYTVTLFRDNPSGLALDSVYPRELEALRHRGAHLLEIGMLADRRRSAARSMRALLLMMRWATCYCLHTDFTDVLAGVHPRHAAFYTRFYGFQPIGEVKSYPLVHDHLVVPMYLQLREAMRQPNLPRGLQEARDYPVPMSAFEGRFQFDPARLEGSLIARFMQDRYGMDVAHPADPTRAAPAPQMTDRAIDATPKPGWLVPAAEGHA